jgi:hypothetical protein
VGSFEFGFLIQWRGILTLYVFRGMCDTVYCNMLSGSWDFKFKFIGLMS